MKGMFSIKMALAAMTIFGAMTVPMSAQAQWRRGDDWQQRRGPGRRNWEYRAIKTLGDRTERESNAVRATFETDFNHFHWNRRPMMVDAKRTIQRMDESMEGFRRAVDSRHPWSGRDELQNAIANAREVRSFMDRNRDVSRAVRDHWRNFRENMNQLADWYGISGI